MQTFPTVLPVTDQEVADCELMVDRLRGYERTVVIKLMESLLLLVKRARMATAPHLLYVGGKPAAEPTPGPSPREKRLADYEYYELVEQEAQRSFLELHQEEFTRFKLQMGRMGQMLLQWKREREKEKS